MKSTKLYIALPIALGMVLTSGIAPGNAAHGDHDSRPRHVETLTVDPPLFSPLSLATGRHNTEVYVTQNFAGTLDRITEDGDLRKVYKTAKKGTEVGAVSRFRDTLYFMEGTGAGEHDPAPNVQVIKSRSDDGRVHDIADVAKHEAKHNPDGKVTYGFRHVDSKSCLDQIKMPMDRPDKYKGSVDSHAYATAVNRRSIFVADAGANAVFRINKDSERVRTVAVLPATKVKITEELAREKKLPDCVIGERLYLEPVPTDVEIGDDGWLYVSTLPGGAEDTSWGELGAVYKVHPWTGKTIDIADGFAGATGLALSRRGDIYVAEMFGDKISVVREGSERVRTFLKTKVPGAVEIKGRTLYATMNAAPQMPAAGQVIKVRLR
ncbi:ScyD/ScyE family protein [Arthrobacter crystallopoietes]|uniref:ScyD/ScyE family protein n=1 Tax=Crystallibacter crystallopoietes TaxID=37928 RepID=UPI0011115232|nr:ScyD/ScyE family protein [Arthrobacter crystallopoietes]